MSPFWKGALVGIAAYWVFQHFSGMGTSGLGARQSKGGGAGPASGG